MLIFITVFVRRFTVFPESKYLQVVGGMVVGEYLSKQLLVIR